MSLWRAKRKYEANQDLNETADDALLAIALLRNNRGDFSVYSQEEVQADLQDGAEILRNTKKANEKPNEVSSYYLALADHLRTSGRKQTTSQFKRDLTSAVTALSEASGGLTSDPGLDKAEKLLRRVEEFTSETSKRNADHMRGHLAGGSR